MAQKNDYAAIAANGLTSVLFATLFNMNRVFSSLDTVDQVDDFKKTLCDEIGCLSFAAKDRIKFESSGLHKQ